MDSDLESIRRRVAATRPAVDPLQRLLANVEGTPTPELLALLKRPVRPASVLLTLLSRPPGLTVLFTERAAHLKDHAGQVSFPGGRLAHAGETPVAAALREAEEEIGLPPAVVDVFGTLDVHLTGTGFSVTPVVGLVTEGEFAPVPDPREVARVFEVPLEFILDPRNLSSRHRERFGSRFRTHELEYQGHRIWGATAAILVSFRNLITHG